MKILMVSDFYPPIIGGTYRYVQLLSRQLVKRHHQVVVCTIGNSWLNTSEDDRGVKVIRLQGFFQRIPFLFKNAKEKYPPPIQDPSISRSLQRVVVNEKPDVIHAHGWILYSAFNCKDKFGIPLVVTLHDYGFVCPKKTLLRENTICDKLLTISCITCAREQYGTAKSTLAYCSLKLNKRKLKSVDKYLAISSFVKDLYSGQLDLDKEDIAVIPNFCEEEKYDPKLEANRAFPDDFILFVGALSPHKGIDVLVEAYEKLKTETKLIVIGRQSPDYSLKTIKNVRTVENAPFNTILGAYSKCRFVVMPSIWPEPFGLVALEAMGCRKALIASNVGGLRDIVVNRETGILVPPNDSGSLAEAMRYLLENPLIAKEMGRRGYDCFTKEYTPDVIVPKIEKIYADLCSSARG